ncbi:putative oxidoreductase of aldo/keto reductase family [Desulfosporosinus acidiphilus SJ4]|uniref:Putative oxidoreductase of aldo/keto reductase family n=1 Tax=Desulfosporosinus acidiphilus (strain DSM 22704 / JCM 16185 / SJ4) TaxID=646529 RepID=I4D9W1_DESAJ|nr:aldo/keto reductase [Desulfosporosinus acidiphilus]AFM42585.1 putative oxidoreductase of aldo/keto reductase family [Desulfosporosinus acidiphilus SJ4]
MKYRKLGRTGLNISEVGFGCIPIIRLSTKEAVHLLQYAFERGINFFDTANAYRDSEEKIGLALKEKRDKIVLATKTGKRDAAGAMEHIENSLRLLQTDYIDLFQFHQVSKVEDWKAILAPGGAFEAVVKAKEQGKIRHIGITSHSYEMSLKLIKTKLFVSIMFPFSFLEDQAKEEMLPLTQQYEMAFLSMKPFGGGVIDSAALAFKFLRQYPEAITIPGFDSVAYLDEVLSFYEQPNVVTEEDIAAMENYRKDLGSQFCRRCEYCQPCPNGVMITPAMGYPIVAKRMSPDVSVEFSKKAMESVAQCISCGICIERCPYDLPIPDILQRNQNLYAEHIKSISK